MQSRAPDRSSPPVAARSGRAALRSPAAASEGATRRSRVRGRRSRAPRSRARAGTGRGRRWRRTPSARSSGASSAAQHRLEQLAGLVFGQLLQLQAWRFEVLPQRNDRIRTGLTEPARSRRRTRFGWWPGEGLVRRMPGREAARRRRRAPLACPRPARELLPRTAGRGAGDRRCAHPPAPGRRTHPVGSTPLPESRVPTRCRTRPRAAAASASVANRVLPVPAAPLKTTPQRVSSRRAAVTHSSSSSRPMNGHDVRLADAVIGES